MQIWIHITFIRGNISKFQEFTWSTDDREDGDDGGGRQAGGAPGAWCPHCGRCPQQRGCRPPRVEAERWDRANAQPIFLYLVKFGPSFAACDGLCEIGSHRRKNWDQCFVSKYIYLLRIRKIAPMWIRIEAISRSYIINFEKCDKYLLIFLTFLKKAIQK